jgi:4'-phosphopantetheinyl transferase EntD
MQSTFRLERAGVVFPPRLFQVALARIEDEADDLLPAEREALRRAVPARLASYAAGRRCARRALRQLDTASGADPRGEGPILRDGQGCPLWPAHAAGSISHSPTVAIAVVADRACARAIGVDLESLDRSVGAATLERVFMASECRWLAGQPEAERERLAYAVFAAREALYKCVYQACRHRLAPDEVELRMVVPHGAFCAEWRGAAGALDLPARLSGRFTFDALHVLAGVWCPPVLPSSTPRRNP